MKMLKIGSLNLPVDRWEDGLEIFDEITVLKLCSAEKKNAKLKYIDIEFNNIFSKLFRKVIEKINRRKWGEKFLELCIIFLRFSLKKQLKKIENVEYDVVHVSYNDFDDSALLLLLVKPYLKNGCKITRAYKETRMNYDYLEKKSFQLSDRIILNEKENVSFFKNKYGKNIFFEKEVLTGLDEDAIGSKYIQNIRYADKLSEKDGKKHIVILAGRVFSDSEDQRSGSRLYYIPMIKMFIKEGLCVHLHTLKIIPDKKGINQYEKLQKEYDSLFYIEKPLDFGGDGWRNAYSVLSRYDYGIMHNYIEGTTNTEFDKYNIPHRYYEYELAHVIPLLQKNKTIVLQRVVEENNTALIYENPKELLDDYEVQFKIESFYEYLKKIYT